MPDFAPLDRVAPSTITGTRGPENILSNRLPVDMDDEIHKYMPNATPLVTLTGKVREKRTARQYRFDWLEKDEYPRNTTVASDALAGDTTINVAAGTGARFKANDVVLNVETREHFILTATPAADALAVTRGIGGSASAMSAGDRLLIMATVFEDGASFGSLKSIQETAQYNYCEIIRTQYGFTGREVNTDLYGGKDPMTERQFFGVEHKKALEYRAYFGKRHAITTGTHYKTYSGGLEYFISSNVWDLNGQKPTERAFVEFLEAAMKWGDGGNQFGEGIKYGLFSSRWLTEIEFWAKNRLEYVVLDKQIGLAATKYVTTHGTLMLMKSNILDYAHQDWGFIIDPNHIRMVTHQGRSTKLLTDRQANDADLSEEEYFTDGGWQIELEAAHSILKGLPQ